VKVPNAVIDFAKANGYETAEYLCDWRDFHCFEPILNPGEISFIGLPLLVLMDSRGKIRMSTPDEAMKQLEECNYE
jgi:hypothetical protein